MEKRSHSDIQNYLLRQKWITTDEIIAFEQKIEAKVQLAVDEAGNWEPL
jgi:TPP-dependent pyruvate/acetoin dehydrogenase alpha subunit